MARARIDLPRRGGVGEFRHHLFLPFLGDAKIGVDAQTPAPLVRAIITVPQSDNDTLVCLSTGRLHAHRSLILAGFLAECTFISAWTMIIEFLRALEPACSQPYVLLVRIHGGYDDRLMQFHSPTSLSTAEYCVLRRGSAEQDGRRSTLAPLACLLLLGDSVERKCSAWATAQVT